MTRRAGGHTPASAPLRRPPSPRPAQEAAHRLAARFAATPATLLPPLLPATSATRAAWCTAFQDTLYGTLPEPPHALRTQRTALDGPPGEACERLEIELTHNDRRETFDAALFLPPAAAHGPVPAVVALAFLGPLGILAGDRFPLDRRAVIDAEPALGATGGHLNEAMRGAHAARWPLALFREAGVALVLACYGSFVADDPAGWRASPLPVLLGESGARGALSLWAYALHRLLDAALTVGEIDPHNVCFAGHSRLGKAALLAAATDPRAAGVFVNNAGCAGPALASLSTGERLSDLVARFPHWLRADPRLPDGLDQHHLIAALAPRKVHIASAIADEWADPLAEYAGLCAAAPAWDDAALPAPPELAAQVRDTQDVLAVGRAPVSFHLRAGAHGLTPADWRATFAQMF